MSLTRQFLRPFLRTARPAPTFSAVSRRTYAQQDYGSGTGDPAGEKPQDQGPSKSSDLEHPGPPPPKVGQGTGTTPTKGTATGHNTEAPDQKRENVSSANATGHSGGGSSKRQYSTSAGGSGAVSGQGKGGEESATKGAQPKILRENPPPESEQSEDVKAHNRDMDNRAEKAYEKVQDQDVEKDKVGKGFWKGQGGKDDDP